MSTFIDISKLRIGMRVRIRRRDEMTAIVPEWNEDPTSNGRFYVNYGKHRIIGADVLGSEYVIDTIRPGTDEFWAYDEFTDSYGTLHRNPNIHLYDSLVAEILDPIEAVKPKCNCGKAKAGRNDMGSHSSWCNVTQGYVPLRDRS